MAVKTNLARTFVIKENRERKWQLQGQAEWGRPFVATWEKSWARLYVDVDVPGEKEPAVV